MLKIVTVPSNTLTQPTKLVVKIDEKIKKLILEMEKILIAQTDPPGVGLAANQVGINLSLFIIKPSIKAKIKVFINPRIIKFVNSFTPRNFNKAGLTRKPSNKKTRKQKVKLEGCLSIPRIWGPVKRADKIFLHYQDLVGKKHLKWFAGFEAMIIQHEVDHLNGIVFTQRAVEQKNQLYKEENEELVKISLID